MSKKGHFYCVGSTRGACGVKHRTPAAAGKCTKRDSAACVKQGGYTDRGLMHSEREVTEDEDNTFLYFAYGWD